MSARSAATKHRIAQLRQLQWWLLSSVLGAAALWSLMLLLHDRHKGISMHERWHMMLLAMGTVIALVIAVASSRREMILARTRAGFVAGVSHELRMPLAQILLASETLALQREQGAADRVSLAESIVRETQRLMGIVDNVLLFSRAGAVAMKPVVQPVYVDELFGRVHDGLRLVAQAAGQTIETEGDTSAMVMGDLRLLTHALVNLADNAIKYGPSGQVVRLEAARVGARVRLTVDDSGPGVLEASRERVFQPYERLGRDGLSERTGSGLGLAVVRTITDALGGTVWLESATGGGTRAVIELPSAGRTA
ncbi:MAG: HAMP domain-containing histidine kinase [Gemmatimonadota bacterium]|nr:HAMP domain-containing histidine kinase [Gemmatimonadota bacterium]